MQNTQNHRSPEGLVVKLTHRRRGLILQVLETLERDFHVTEVSRFKENRGGDGFHVFVTIRGSKN